MSEYEECNSCGKETNVKNLDENHEHIYKSVCIEYLRYRVDELEKQLKKAASDASTALAVLERLDRAGRL